MNIELSLNDELGLEGVIEIYEANDWSAAEKPEKLLAALRNSDSLVTARMRGPRKLDHFGCEICRVSAGCTVRFCANSSGAR